MAWRGDGKAARAVTATSACLSYEGEDSRDDNGPAREGVGPGGRKREKERRGLRPFSYFFFLQFSFSTEK